MSYAEYVNAVPTPVRLIITVVVFVSLSVALAWGFYGHSLRLAQEPETPDEKSGLAVPKATSFVDRILATTMFAFVFLLAFMLGQFWFNVRSADEDNTNFAFHYGAAVGYARMLPADAGGDIMMQALADYRSAIIEDAWPLMVNADPQGSIALQKQATLRILDAEFEAYKAGASEQPAWGATQGAIGDMVADSADLTVSAPGMGVTGALLLLYFLGITNLVLLALFSVTRIRFYLLGVGIVAGITAVMLFVVTDLSNPFAGPHAVVPNLMQVPGFS